MSKSFKTFDDIRLHCIEHNGLTLNILTSKSPKRAAGYFVSLANGKILTGLTFSAAALSDFIIDNLWTLTKRNHFLGIWIDKDAVYIDVSIWVSSCKRALETAQNNKQIAIFSCKDKKSIYLQ